MLPEPRSPALVARALLAVTEHGLELTINTALQKHFPVSSPLGGMSSTSPSQVPSPGLDLN